MRGSKRERRQGWRNAHTPQGTQPERCGFSRVCLNGNNLIIIITKTLWSDHVSSARICPRVCVRHRSAQLYRQSQCQTSMSPEYQCCTPLSTLLICQWLKLNDIRQASDAALRANMLMLTGNLIAQALKQLLSQPGVSVCILIRAGSYSLLGQRTQLQRNPQIHPLPSLSHRLTFKLLLYSSKNITDVSFPNVLF